ncbi:MAG: hypothetical protein ACYCQI_14390 [Gammaproteobacteria bacterium]
MKLKYVSSLAAIIFSLCSYNSVYANGCNDFTVHVDNRTQESLYVVYQTPNGLTSQQPLPPGRNTLGTAINIDNKHDDTWETVRIFKADKTTPIFIGTLAKDKLNKRIIVPCEGTNIYMKGHYIQDGNYTMQGNTTEKGYCNQPTGRNTRGEWQYTLLKD